MPVTIALVSHDSVGLGHARRNRTLAYACARHLPDLIGDEVRGMLIAGHPDASKDSLPRGWDWLILPGLTHGTDGLGPRNIGISKERLGRIRSATIHAALAELEPDVFIADRHPYGIRGEMRPVIRHLRELGTATVLGLREVLDTPEVVQREWERLGGAQSVAEDFDAVWIYGDTNLYDPRATGEVPPELARIAEPTGYLGRGRPEESATMAARAGARGHGISAGADGIDIGEHPYVLTVVGGGSDGIDLAAMSILADVPTGTRHIVIAGPQMPDSHVRHLEALSGDHVTLVKSSHRVPELIAGAEGVISMGGYNTSVEIMASDTPALVVPRASRRDEQPLRARAMAQQGVIDTLALEDLSVEFVSRWLAHVRGKRVDRSHIDLGGLQRIPHLIADLLEGRHVAKQYETKAVSREEMLAALGQRSSTTERVSKS